MLHLPPELSKLLMQLKRMILVGDTWSLKFVTAAVSFQ